jgi:hypothetical protein
MFLGGPPPEGFYTLFTGQSVVQKALLRKYILFLTFFLYSRDRVMLALDALRQTTSNVVGGKPNEKEA